jgi:protein-L-isoaspartate(D-aspartate) O-methyltransferase
LCLLGAKVLVLKDRELFKQTSILFPKLNIPNIFLWDGYTSYAPFDSIIVTAGAPFIPQPLNY